MKYGECITCTMCKEKLTRENGTIEEIRAEIYGYCPKCQLKIKERLKTN